MSVPGSRLAPTPRAAALRAIDWRTVAAVGLPLWAFLLGVVVARPAPPAPPPIDLTALGPPAPPVEPVPEGPEVAPMPRAVVVRHEIVSVPVAVPVMTVTEVASAPNPEFRLPASEFLPAERCQTHNTKVKFHPGVPEAAEEARNSKKLLLVLHISGHFDDPGFT